MKTLNKGSHKLWFTVIVVLIWYFGLNVFDWFVLQNSGDKFGLIFLYMFCSFTMVAVLSGEDNPIEMAKYWYAYLCPFYWIAIPIYLIIYINKLADENLSDKPHG